MVARKEKATQAIRSLVRRKRAVDIEALQRVIGSSSRMTVFRRLKEIGYLSSFTHGGRYYTLRDVPEFDELGLWFTEGIGFSRQGTLKETLVYQVEEAPDGRTHGELRHVLRVRVHNPLHELVVAGRIGRERYKQVNLYVSSGTQRAVQQVEQRHEVDRVMSEVLRVVTTEETIEVLVEALRSSPAIPSHELVAEQLAARGVRIESRLVLQVYETYGMVTGKKTPGLST